MEHYYTSMENHKHLNLRSNIFYFLLFFLFVIFHLPFLSSCSNNTQGKRSQDSTVYSLENFTPFTLDTFVITKYIQHDSSQMDIASDLVEFYQKRFYQYAWFTQSGMSNAVHLLLNRLNNAAHQSQNNLLKITQVLDSIKLDSR